MFRYLWPRSKFFVDEAEIRIIISRDHEQTPTAASLEDDEQRILKKGLYVYTLQDQWSRAKSIFDRFRDMVRIPLTPGGDPILHVAIREKRKTFLQELVNFMTPEELETPNEVGNTAFCMAAAAGNGHFLKIMTRKNKNLEMIRGQDGMLPIHFAASNGNSKIVQFLCPQKLLLKMDDKDIERLFFLAIKSNMYDLATYLFNKYPTLATASDEKGLSALHMLARKNSKEFDMQEGKNKKASSRGAHGLELFKNLWSQVSELEPNQFLKLTHKPLPVLIEAGKSGNIEVVRWILYKNREELEKKDSKERNLLHYAVLYRQGSILDFIFKMEKLDNNVIRAADKDGNSILHLAAYRLTESQFDISHIGKEIRWYKEVEKKVPQLKKALNSEYETPEEIFLNKFGKIIEAYKESGNRIIESGMVVATLTATIAFTAVLTAPGERNSKWFVVFFLSNAVALLTSFASIVTFMSTFGLKFSKEESTVDLLRCVDIGRRLLFVSIFFMVIAFAAASFLIFDHTSEWVTDAVASVAALVLIISVLTVLWLKVIPLIVKFFRSRIYITIDHRKYE